MNPISLILRIVEFKMCLTEKITKIVRYGHINYYDKSAIQFM